MHSYTNGTIVCKYSVAWLAARFGISPHLAAVLAELGGFGGQP